MRPPKILLCVCENESESSVLSYMFRTNGYRCLMANSEEEAKHIFTESTVDIVLIYHSTKVRPQLVNELKQVASHIPMLLVSPAADQLYGQIILADALFWHKTPHIELLERIRVMARRKRGPRKGSVRQATPADQELAEALPA